MARVQVSDEIWTAYRAGLGATPVSVALGELVRREVGRVTRRFAGDIDGIGFALTDARELADELAALIDRLELASSAHSTPNLEPVYSEEPQRWPGASP